MADSGKPVVTRFAPSPTGFLHIGGARTALFNWLFTRHHGGTFRLRIEDTDKARSTPEAIEAIIEGLTWLGLQWDEEIVYQSQRAARHVEVAHQLVEKGKAYYCYCSPEELAQMREEARTEGRRRMYDGRWRDRDPSEAPKGVPPVVRLKMPLSGETVIDDAVQGSVTVPNGQLDDMILLRADRTPTYMLSVVVDDHDMGITDIVRGDDHLTNAFRQLQLFKAMDWPEPSFAHIPLIHGPDGAKLSKRHGALGVEAYRDMGYLPEALRNYLLRLGWSHGDDEIIPSDQAIKLFDLAGVNKAAARFDYEKLNSLNGHYIRSSTEADLLSPIAARLETSLGRSMSADEKNRLLRGMAGLKMRAKTLVDLAESAAFYLASRPLQLDEKARKLLEGDARSHLAELADLFENLDDWREELLEQTLRDLAESKGLKLGKIAQPLRAALTGSTVSPGIFEVMSVLGKSESLGRIRDQATAP